uniref:Uncharacterized protein n=1 Tax=Myotis myotis TaxID=51298 RepID=A0A7J7S1Z3_MYOMY|nr:hypothetical protein mMyoMyo1_010103 [Myotis myotis]
MACLVSSRLPVLQPYKTTLTTTSWLPGSADHIDNATLLEENVASLELCVLPPAQRNSLVERREAHAVMTGLGRHWPSLGFHGLAQEMRGGHCTRAHISDRCFISLWFNSKAHSSQVDLQLFPPRSE